MHADLVDGERFWQMLSAGTALLHERKEEVDALNVFPVPDGDTGTNMYLTLLAALREVEKTSRAQLGQVVDAAAQGALMGARGNSGVILSQLFRGFAKAVAGLEALDKCALAKGLTGAAVVAYQAVRKPVEGTILTVVKEAAKAAEAAAQQEASSLVGFFEEIYAHASITLSRTPEMLPTLKQAGVVDAGGKGWLIILEGAIRALKGQPVNEPGEIREAVPRADMAGIVVSEDEPFNINFQYCTEFLLRGTSLSVEEIQADLAPHGDSLLVVGDEQVVKIHLHTNNPGLILDYAVRLGELSEIQINNMIEQSRARLDRIKQAKAAEAPSGELKEIGLVAVAIGDGLAQIFRSLGVDEIVEGGQTMNPSTEEILKSFENLPTDKIIILPNNKNITLAAQSAASVTVKKVAVIPSKSVPQGLSAILRLDPDGDFERVVKDMTGAIADVETGEVTIATRNVEINGVDVQEGQVIALLNGTLVLSTENLDDACLGLLEKAGTEERERITLFYGQSISKTDVNRIVDKIREKYPSHEIELHEGGQPHYQFIISIE